MEHEERFSRIESALEALVGVQSAQARNLEALVGVQSTQTRNLETLAGLVADIAIAQVRTEKRFEELSIKSAETQGKLDALIHMWDEMIRERGGKNGKPEPPAA